MIPEAALPKQILVNLHNLLRPKKDDAEDAETAEQFYASSSDSDTDADASDPPSKTAKLSRQTQIADRYVPSSTYDSLELVWCDVIVYVES